MPGNSCDVCGREAGFVCASRYGPCSFAYCTNCLRLGLEPYGAVVAYISCAGYFPEEINESYQEDVRRMFPLWGKTEEEFIDDVEKMIRIFQEDCDEW